jgi:hypothetical protein
MYSSDKVFLTIIGFALLYLCFKRWFWVCVFGLACLASIFSILASIIHFQILAAIGFTFLAVVTALILEKIVDY